MRRSSCPDGWPVRHMSSETYNAAPPHITNFDLRLAQVRDLRQNPALAPDGPAREEFLQTFLPMVYGAAYALVDDSQIAERISTAVMLALRQRWRKLPAKTMVASWL